MDRIFHDLAGTKFFTEWFSPYTMMEFNIFTVFFIILFLPYACIGVMKDIYFSRKNSN
ncbi:hypothetical protein IFO66_14900 [Paenibacillus sp. CAU 1523]|uniref:Uncharacterized protein n=1 Tax=Paenibacillus arenosi TaxID=2774142 RepID=A0ABR9B2C8_9BACL|nr:hypothetical protein [Paenibacillus arenosi]